jgi:Rrf2 family protein
MSSVLRVSEAASLAMHTMVLLAKNPDRAFTTGEIAATLGVSSNHLAKVLQRLAHVGLVKSNRGRKGGFTTGKPTDKVTLLEVFETIEGPISPRKCLLPVPMCDGSTCILGRLLQSVNKQFVDQLSSATLADLA